jgi:hypothetical protein
MEYAEMIELNGKLNLGPSYHPRLNFFDPLMRKMGGNNFFGRCLVGGYNCNNFEKIVNRLMSKIMTG